MQKPHGLHWEIIDLLPSAEHTVEADAVGDTLDLGDWNRMLAILDITASATDAGDTLDVFVDVSFDQVNWFNAIHFTQQAGNGSAVQELAALHPATPDASDPHAVKVITGDAAAAAVRPQLGGPYVRARSTVVRLTGTDEAHTFSVQLYIN